MTTATSQPFVPIVRSLLKYPMGSREFEDALTIAGPEEREFALEILAHQKARPLEARGRDPGQARGASRALPRHRALTRLRVEIPPAARLLGDCR